MNPNEKKQTVLFSFEFLRRATVIYKCWLEDLSVFQLQLKMSISVQFTILKFYKSIFIKGRIIYQVEKQHSS